jgi:hypothetical protein
MAITPDARCPPSGRWLAEVPMQSHIAVPVVASRIIPSRSAWHEEAARAWPVDFPLDSRHAAFTGPPSAVIQLTMKAPSASMTLE